MTVRTYRESVKTQGEAEVLDITPLAQKALGKSALQNGVLNAFVPGSTAAITTIEFESGAVHDLRAAIERIAERFRAYPSAATEVGWVISPAEQSAGRPDPKKPADTARCSWGLELRKQ